MFAVDKYLSCIFLILFVKIYEINCSEGFIFDYEHQAKWYDQFVECSLNRQSPIELNSYSAILNYSLPPITFTFYDREVTIPSSLTNNGVSANLILSKPKNYYDNLSTISDTLLPQITGGQLPNSSFIAESIHFHWGSNDQHGSEHVIDSERFSMEMHIVHRNTKYQTVDEAREHEDGLAVVAVLYSAKDNGSNFNGLDNVITALSKIANSGDATEILNISLSTLLGNLDTEEFYTYQGSLTTPPCSQAVTWIIFSHAIEINHRQMNEFHQLRTGSGDILENNYRSLQSIGNRIINLRRKRKVTDSIIQSMLYWKLLNLINSNANQTENEIQTY